MEKTGKQPKVTLVQKPEPRYNIDCPRCHLTNHGVMKGTHKCVHCGAIFKVG